MLDPVRSNLKKRRLLVICKEPLIGPYKTLKGLIGSLRAGLIRPLRAL